MSEKKNLKKLEKLIFDILADMFFLFPEEGPPQISDQLYEAKVSISGKDRKTELYLYLDLELAKKMAQNFIGEEEISENDVNETVKEFANMVAGNYIGIIDPDGEMSLSIPEVKTISASNIPKEAVNKYQIDGNFLGVAVTS